MSGFFVSILFIMNCLALPAFSDAIKAVFGANPIKTKYLLKLYEILKNKFKAIWP